MKNIPLLIILAIGILTPIAATALFYFAPPSSYTMRGEVLSPQKTPPEWNLQDGKWTLLTADENGKCGAQCMRRLCQMRQLRLMLPGHYFRLQRAWLRNENANPPPQMFASADCGEKRAAAFAENAEKIDITEGIITIRGDSSALPKPANGNARSDYLYLIDPAGIYALRFPPALDAYAIRKDLAKLLKISKGRRKIETGESDN